MLVWQRQRVGTTEKGITGSRDDTWAEFYSHSAARIYKKTHKIGSMSTEEQENILQLPKPEEKITEENCMQSYHNPDTLRNLFQSSQSD